MKPWCWRLGMAVGGLGAGVMTPYLAGGSMLYAVDLPLSGLRFGMVFDYWAVLEQPAFVPFAWRIRVSSVVGALPLPAVWLCSVVRAWRLAFPGPPRSRFSPLERAPNPARRGIVLAPETTTGASVLVTSTSGFHGTILPTLRRLGGPVLYVGTRSAQRGAVACFAPFGQGLRWNPFTEAWTPTRLRRDVLHSLAGRWYPFGDDDARLLVSHARSAFVSLVGVVDDILRAAGAGIPPSPGDVYRFAGLLESRQRRRIVERVAALPMLSAPTRDGLRTWLSLDEPALRRVCHALREPLAVFGDPTVDASTRGNDFARIDLTSMPVLFEVPIGRQRAITPLLDAFAARWRHLTRDVDGACFVIDELDAFGRLPTLFDRDMRCLATVTRLSHLDERYGRDMPLVWKRFPCVLLPRDTYLGGDDENELAGYHAVYWPRDYRRSPVRASDFEYVADGDQLVLTPASSLPKRCRVPKTRRRPVTRSSSFVQGDAMRFPQPLAVVLASLVAALDMPPARAATIEPLVLRQDANGKTLPVPLVLATLGPHRFRFPQNLYDDQVGPYMPGKAFMLSVQWPELAPLPSGIDYHDTAETFISRVGIEVWRLDKLSDEAYLRRLDRVAGPDDPDDPVRAQHPGRNLDLRIKAPIVYGLVPYLADFEKLKAYYEGVYGAAYPAAEPSNNDDFFLQMDGNGHPVTVIRCASRLLPDGMRIRHGRIVDAVEEDGTRSSCDHDFLIPEYRLMVSLSYPRVVLFDWKRIEQHVRTLIRRAEIK